MKNTVVCLTFLLVLVTQNHALNLRKSLNRLTHGMQRSNIDDFRNYENNVDTKKPLGEFCEESSECLEQNSHCEGNQCVCDQPLVKSEYHDYDLCIPETIQYNVEHKYDEKWNDAFMDKSSKKYNELADPIESVINNLNDPFLVDYVLPNFQKTNHNKVKSEIIVIYRNAYHHNTVQRRSKSEQLRRRRASSLASLKSSLSSIPGVSSVLVSTNGHLNDPCADDDANRVCKVANSVCSSTCQCGDGYVMILPDVENCYEEVDFGGSCTKNKQCVGIHQKCSDNECACNNGFFEGTDTLGTKGCYQARSNLGNECSIAAQCDSIDHATCISGECACGDGYGQVGNTNVCKGIFILGSSCTENEQCAADHSECSTTCSCATGYVQSGDECLALLGYSCSTSNDCAPIDSKCNDAGLCECISGTESVGDSHCDAVERFRH